VLALWSEKTGDPTARERAFRSLNWTTYFFEDNGVVKSSLDDDTGYWFSDGYGDLMRHYLKAMAAIPEFAPAGEDHLLRSTSVVQKLERADSHLFYETFDSSSDEVLRLRAAPAQVLVDRQPLRSEISQSGDGYLLRSLDGGGVRLEIRHRHGHRIEVIFARH
jgi:hypothetical protein